MTGVDVSGEHSRRSDFVMAELREGPIRPGAVLKGRYRLERLLGRGGMASVWLACDRVLERDVAVKVLSDTISSDPGFLARFRREARVAAGLSHPNLIGVWDYAESGERPYLVMEYVPGDNVAQRISQGHAIDCERLARELLGALAHIHAAGIVHRDVKPQNVLIAPDGAAKLIDFGIALPADATALTHTGQLLGTARFIAPEVMSGAPATRRSDLYSSGVVLRDCLGADPSRRLRALVGRLTSTDPRDRPASAEAAFAALGGRPPAREPITEPLRAPDRSQTTDEYEPTEQLRTAEPPRRTAPVGPADSRRSRPAWARVAAVAGITAVLAALAALVLAGGSSDDTGGGAKPTASAAGREGQPSGTGNASAAGSGTETEAGAGEETEAGGGEEIAATPTEPASEDPALGSSLNQQGFEMIQSGRYEEAVPVLEEAVQAYPPESDDVEYGYALFNLANALRLSGRPEEAIPILERRLQIPDQIDVVREELSTAESEAAAP